MLFVGWRYWALPRDSSALDAEIADAQQETTRLHSIIQQVQQFEQQKAQLQQRVVLIEQLRKGQTGPVHMLDQISRALPPMLWLTELKQTDGTDVVDRRQVHDADRPVGFRGEPRGVRLLQAVDRDREHARPKRAGTPPGELDQVHASRPPSSSPATPPSRAAGAKAGG